MKRRDSVSNRLWIWLAISVFAASFGCGGGGGGGGGSTGPTAPPPTGALKLNAGDSRATFTNMKAAFNNFGQGVVVWEAMTGQQAHVLWAFFDGAVLQPEAELYVGGQQPVVATNGTDFMIVWNAGGQIYSAPCNSSGVLGTSVAISGGSVFDPDVTSNGSGYAAAWSGYDSGSGEYRIHANIYSSLTWTVAKRIDGISGYAHAPKIASNGSGYAITWRKQSGGTYDVYATVSTGVTATATWAAPSALENQNLMAFEPKIASNGSTYAVVWGQDDGSSYSFFGNVYTGATWTSGNTVLLENSSGYSYYMLDIAIASNGISYVAAWDQFDGTAHSIYTNIYSGGTWTNATVIESSPNLAYSVTIASSGTGTGYAVAWQQDNGTGFDVYANLYSNGTWSTPVLLDAGTSNALTPLAVRFPSGYAVAWFQDDASGNPNMYGRIFASGSWYPESPLVQGVWKGTTMLPKMATNRNGVSLAVWPEYHKGDWRLYGSINATGTWGTPFLIDGNVFSNDTVEVATNGTEFLVLWYSTSITQGGLMAVTCSSSGVLGTAERVDLAGSGIHSLALASNSSGYAAVWSRWDGVVANSLYSNIYSNGSWSKDSGGNPTPWLIENGPNYAVYPKIASNGSGYAATWMQSDGAANSIYANLFTSGTWSTGGTSLEASTYSAYAPSIASNGSGYAATWTQSDGLADHVYANIYSNGTWSAGGTKLDNIDNYAFEPQIASNGSGYGVAWYQLDGPWYSVFVNIYSNGTWSSGGTLIENFTGSVTWPSIASDGKGYAVSWSQHDGVRYNLYANLYSSGNWSTSPTLFETTDGNAFTSMIISNGNKYSVIWWQQDPADLAVYDVWARLGIF